MASLIKHTRVPRLAGTQAAGLEVAALSERASQLLQDAREEAAKILDQARKDADLLRCEAQETGRQAAADTFSRQVENEVAKRLETMLPAVKSLVGQLEDTKDHWQCHWEASAVQLATAIAERIIRRELRDEPKVALEIIREALQLAASSAGVSIRLNPSDFQNLGSQVARLAETLCRLGPTKIVSDSSITPGGCLVDTQFGVIDQQIESQLKRIEQELL